MADEQEKEVPVTVNEPKQDGEAQAQAPEAEAPSQPAEYKSAQPVKAEKAEKVEKAEKAPKAAKPAKSADYTPRLRDDYDERIVPAMIEKFGYKNRMEVPRLEKIVLNMGVGEATQDKKKVETAASEMELIAGQKPVITKAKKSIAQFKLREGMPIGVKVTLRSERMYEFLDRLVTIALPRVRDFRGPEPEELRRPRQLRHGPQGAARVPRDQLRPHREGAGHGHHRHHHREDGRRGARAAAPLQLPLPAQAEEAQRRRRLKSWRN